MAASQELRAPQPSNPLPRGLTPAQWAEVTEYCDSKLSQKYRELTVGPTKAKARLNAWRIPAGSEQEPVRVTLDLPLCLPEYLLGEWGVTEIEVYDLSVTKLAGGRRAYVSLLFAEDGVSAGKPRNQWLRRNCKLFGAGEVLVFGSETRDGASLQCLAAVPGELPSLPEVQTLLLMYAYRAARLQRLIEDVFEPSEALGVECEMLRVPGSRGLMEGCVSGLAPLMLAEPALGGSMWNVELDCLTCTVKWRTLAVPPPGGFSDSNREQKRNLQELLRRAAVVRSVDYPLIARYMQAARSARGTSAAGAAGASSAERDECPVCMDTVPLVALKACTHKLCAKCKGAWATTCKRERHVPCCPLCRTAL